jgi:hypothetical protein
VLLIVFTLPGLSILLPYSPASAPFLKKQLQKTSTLRQRPSVQPRHVHHTIVLRTPRYDFTMDPPTTTISEQQTTDFFSLPPELRNKIYAYILVKLSPIEPEDPEQRKEERDASGALALLRTSPQFRGGALPMYYGANTFAFHSEIRQPALFSSGTGKATSNRSFVNFFGHLSPASLGMVRRIVMHGELIEPAHFNPQPRTPGYVSWALQHIQPITPIPPIQPIQPMQPIQPIQPFQPMPPILWMQPFVPLSRLQPAQGFEPTRPKLEAIMALDMVALEAKCVQVVEPWDPDVGRGQALETWSNICGERQLRNTGSWINSRFTSALKADKLVAGFGEVVLIDRHPSSDERGAYQVGLQRIRGE